jgi:predicted nucleic acid-binding Zn ribbon protein
VPIYVYRREDGSTIEVEQSIRDDPLTVCPATGQPMQRILQPFGSQRLGLRFYDEVKRREPPEQPA